MIYTIVKCRSLGASRAPNSSWRPFGPAWLHPSCPRQSGCLTHRPHPHAKQTLLMLLKYKSSTLISTRPTRSPAQLYKVFQHKTVKISRRHSGVELSSSTFQSWEVAKSRVELFLGTGCFAGKVCTSSLVGKLDMYHQHHRDCHPHSSLSASASDSASTSASASASWRSANFWLEHSKWDYCPKNTLTESGSKIWGFKGRPPRPNSLFF